MNPLANLFRAQYIFHLCRVERSLGTRKLGASKHKKVKFMERGSKFPLIHFQCYFCSSNFFPARFDFVFGPTNCPWVSEDASNLIFRALTVCKNQSNRLVNLTNEGLLVQPVLVYRNWHILFPCPTFQGKNVSIIPLCPFNKPPPPPPPHAHLSKAPGQVVGGASLRKYSILTMTSSANLF